ncbi:PREDICTED: uncharacterized protein LOC109465787 [Branchiostoma belcheri]|uniref:Uncharacterized protein LOC109465787 n=1 Tax=Branchiostoma belcheri TaxID=7741 RepID=A0A6P4Y902_BRABE|nr:PREDICTED: uncharacterized protein LOC109465787 [Branchiostoma belcheri]
MAGPVRERVTAADRRHFDFVQTLLRISDELTEEETANVKLFCLHLIPKGQAARLRRAVDVFHKLIELDKIDQENLDFLEELLERMGRNDLIRDVLRPFQQPDRQIPENPELQPGTSAEGASTEEATTSDAFMVFRGQSQMVQETVTHQRGLFASLFGTRRSQVKFRGYKKHKSILAHYTVPRENTAVLRLMADHSDPRLVFMGMESLQIDAGVPVKLQQEALLYDIKRQLPVDDIEVGCSTRKKQQRAPRSWTRLWALNLFSDALPLHLQVAASLEYQGFSYSLVRALAERDRLREHQMRRAVHNLRKAEVESKALRQKAEVDSNTLMTLRSKLNIAENRLKEALETNAVLAEKLQQAQEYAEKAARQVTTHVTEYRSQEYRGEKPPGGWPAQRSSLCFRMAAPVNAQAGVTDDDRRHFKFVKTLQKISEDLTVYETKLMKLYCRHLIPKGIAERLNQPFEIFEKLIELGKIDQENLEFVKEILENMERADLVINVLRPFQPPGREIPENSELEPGTNTDGANADGETAEAYLVVQGQRHMIQETVDRHRYYLRSLCRIEGSDVMFRGYRAGNSILVHYTIPRKSTAVLKLMANHSDPRLVFMGVTSLQIDAEPPIKVAQGVLFKDTKRQLPVDDIEVGCSTRKKQQRAPRSWTRLWALNLFSDALPLHLQVAASLEYQGFSYSLVRALAERDRLREHQMRRAVHNLRKAEVDSNTLRQKAEVDSNTLMTLRSKLNIAENRLKEALETNAVLEEKLQQAQEYAEKAARQVATHVTEYRGEKPPGGWSQEYRGEKPPGGWSQEYRGEKPPGGWSQEYREEKPPVGWPAQVEKADAGTQTRLADTDGTTGRPEDGNKVGEEWSVLEEKEKEEDEEEEEDDKEEDKEKDKEEEGKKTPGATGQERPQAGLEGAVPRTTGDVEQGEVTFGGVGTDPGKFKYPRGIVVSPSNEIFVTDTDNRRVQVHSMKGGYLRQFPTVVPGTEDKDMRPTDITVESNGTLWVVGRREAADYVVQYSPDGTAMAGFGLRKNKYYRGIAVDMRTNQILVTDAERGEVEVFRPDGSLVRRFGHPEGEMRDPQYITVDGEGNILVSDMNNHYIYVYKEDGQFLFQFGGEGSGKGQLKDPCGICTDRAGNIIVADSMNKRVQIFTRHGEYLRSIRTESWPGGLAVGPEGQLVINDNDDHTVTIYAGDKAGKEALAAEKDKVTARQGSDNGNEEKEEVPGAEATEQERPQAGIERAATRTTGDVEQGKVTFGGGGSEPGKFWDPRGVVVSPSNEIFVAGMDNMRVQVHSMKGGYLRHFPTVVPGTEDKDMAPHDVSMDSNGTLWVVGNGETADHVVQYSMDGTAMAGFQLRKNEYLRGIAVDMRTNHVLMTDAGRCEVEVFRPDGSLVRRFRHPKGEMKGPRYITVDGEGNILVSDWISHSVYVFDKSGMFLFRFGGKGSGEGQLRDPRGICTDRAGNIIVADRWNGRVQIFTRHGEYLRSIRTGFGPQGLAVGPEGQLVVTCYSNHTVTVFSNY